MSKELIKTTKVTKNLILDELTKIIIDHSINIEPEKLKQKINMLFDDCKDITAELFIENCKILRSQEMFGKLPANYRFNSPVENNIAFLINSIAGFDAVILTKETDEEVKIFCKSPTAKSKIFELGEEKKNKIKALFANKKFEFLC